MSINLKKVDFISSTFVDDLEIKSAVEAFVTDAQLSEYMRFCNSKTQGRDVRAYCKNRGAMLNHRKKPYKQKGTGNARHGSTNSNLFRGGAKAHGPSGDVKTPLKMPKKLRKQCWLSSFSLKHSDNNLFAFGDINYSFGDKFDLKKFQNFIGEGKNLIVVNDSFSLEFVKKVRNLKNITIVNEKFLNAYDIHSSNKVFLSENYSNKIFGGSL